MDGPTADPNVHQGLGKCTDGNEMWKELLCPFFRCAWEKVVYEDRCLYYCLLSNVSHHLVMLTKPTPTQAP